MDREFNPVNSKRRALLGAATGAALILASGTFSIPAHAADGNIYKGFLSNKAVSGYDPVAYFTEGKPVKGAKKFKWEYLGADWFFASQDNLDTFKANPEKYAPQYGGYCAYAVGIGQVAKGNPDNWDIVDGKLYLNYDDNTQNLWHNNQANYIVEGDKNWPTVLE